MPENKRGRECVNYKLDQHTLSFPGKHTLEGQKGQHCLARVSNTPTTTLSAAPSLSGREGEKEEEEEGGMGLGWRAKGARESQRACI